MSFFAEPYDDPIPANKAPGGRLVDGAEGWFARGKAAALRNDANFKVARTKNQVTTSLAESIRDRIPEDRLKEAPSYGMIGLDPTYVDHRDVLSIAREMAAEDPKAWADVDLSEEWVESQLNDRLKSERDELEAIIAMSPDAGYVGSFLAEMAGATLDVKNIPFLVLGGGSGSIARIIGREALINMGAEAAFLPSQFDMAERLEEPDPNVLLQLGMAAGFGGVIGGAVAALGRGISMYRDRNAPTASLPQNPQTEALLNAVEDMVATDQPRETIVQRVNQAVREDQSLAGIEFPPMREEDVLPDSMEREIVEPDRERVRDEIDPYAQRQQLVDEATEQLERDFPEMRRKYPLASRVKIKSKRRDPVTGEMVLTPVAVELQANGITPKTHPFLFNNKTGRGDLDNLAPEDIWDGIGDILPVDPSSQYLTQQGIIDAIVNELAGGRKTPLNAAIEARMQAVESLARSPIEEPVYPSSWDVTREQLDLEDDPFLFVNRQVDGFLEENGAKLFPEEREYVVNRLMENGGDVDSAIERAYIRTAANDIPRIANDPEFAEIPFGEPGGEAGPLAGRGRSDGGATPDSGARQDGSPSPAQFEETAAGSQRVVDGVAPITQRDRLQSEMDRPMQGGNAETDMGLFDLNARAQADMFSDPSSPSARTYQESALQDLRNTIEAEGDFDLDIVTDDGLRFNKASDLLRYAEDGKEFSEILDMCGRTT